MPFLIRHPDKREYELNDVGYFLREYQPQGFVIVDPAPTGYTVPELPMDAMDDASRPMTRSELNTEAARLGIESPEKMPNKEAVIDALNLKMAEIDQAEGNVPQ